MWAQLLMSILSSEMTKQLIAFGIKKLLAHQKDGITKELAVVMIDGIAKSNANDVKQEVFTEALEVLAK